MASKLIKLTDGTLVEIDVPEDQAEQIAGGEIDNVDATIDKIKPILLNICKPITSVWQEISKDMEIEKAEIDVGFSFEGEGNIFITKAKAGANLNIKLVLKPNERV
ncbi:MAG: hypothetical protein GY795_11760 [Desulfobacterales bacterium]|nr:hypothetical protein [Desulfobacterales bacterium]